MGEIGCAFRAATDIVPSLGRGLRERDRRPPAGRLRAEGAGHDAGGDTTRPARVGTGAENRERAVAQVRVNHLDVARIGRSVVVDEDGARRDISGENCDGSRCSPGTKYAETFAIAAISAAASRTSAMPQS